MSYPFGDYYIKDDFAEIEYLKEKLSFWKQLFMDSFLANDVDKAKIYKEVYERIEIDLRIEEKEYHEHYSDKPSIDLFATGEGGTISPAG